MRAQGVTRASDEPTRTQLESLVAVIALAMLAEIDAGGSAAPGTRGDLVAMVDRNVDLAILLTERMSLARAIGDHTVELAPIGLDLAALVRQSVDDLRVAFLAEHPVAIEGLGVLAVRGDPAALREVVFNLLVNAAKYSAAGAAITVTVGCAPPGAQIFVRDHGRDVAAGDAEHIFDEFAEPTRRPPASASGYSSPAASRALMVAISPSARARRWQRVRGRVPTRVSERRAALARSRAFGCAPPAPRLLRPAPGAPRSPGSAPSS